MSTSVSTRESVVTHPSFIDYRQLSIFVDVELAWFCWGPENTPALDPQQTARESELAWWVHELDAIAQTSHSRRTNPATRSMGRVGRKYRVREDHGTTPFYADIKAGNAARRSRQKGSNRSRRRYERLEAECRNPRTVNHAYRELIG